MTDHMSMHPELAEADTHDAAGRHDDAVDVLARATQRGNVEAATRLGKRLVVGDRAPLMPRQGADLLRKAASEGGAEAPARLAVLFAAGITGRPDWPTALELVGVAAERGFDAAARQIEVLETLDPEAVRPGAPGWRTRAARLDAAVLQSPPHGTTLHADPQIEHFADLATAAVCDWITERARGRLGPARVYDPVARVEKVDAARSNSAAGFDLMQADLVQLVVQARMAAGCGHPVTHLEGPNVLHYAVGQTITNHYDFVDPDTPNYADEIARNGQRIITFLLYLNEAYEGGETDFPGLGLRHHGRRGDGLFFVNALPSLEPDRRMLHAGRAPTRGEKWVFSQFVRNRAVLHLG